MDEHGYVLKAPEKISMSGEDARRLIGCGSGDAALLYLYILNSGGHYDRMDAAEKTGRTPEQMDAAMGVLTNIGLVAAGNVPAPKKLERADELPQYTTEDVLAEKETNPDFGPLVDAVQEVLGRKLNPEELKVICGIHGYLGLPYEVILELVGFCREECSKRGRNVSIKYIERVAFTWEREGIFSIDAAEAYIKSLEERRSKRSMAARAVGIRDRQLSETEGKYVDCWLELGFDTEAIAEAYDRTVTNTGKMNWRYMDSIMKSWHSKNLHTLKEIRVGDRAPEPSRPKDGRRPSKTEDEKKREQQPQGATRDDLERMRETLRRIKGEG